MPLAVKNYWTNLSSSLRIRNYRLFLIGQTISMWGTWMQTVALGWLVLQLTGSGGQLGLVVALQFLPLLVLTPFGGILADTFNKRKILLCTQTVISTLPLIIGLLIVSGHLEMWMVYLFVLIFGIGNAIDHPARHTFVQELVGPDNLKNAIALNSTIANLARAVGPMIGGVLIVTVGIGFCFIFNSLSYIPVIISLLLIRSNELHLSKKHPRKKGQLREGWNYVRKHHLIRNILLMAAVTGTLSYEFAVSLPLFAQSVFGAGPQEYAALWIAMGVGSVIGGLYAAGKHDISSHHLFFFSLLFGLSMIATALMPSLDFAVLAMGFVGFFSINVLSLANTMLQLESDPAMRGRVMSLWTMAMLGSTPIGGPIIGFIGEHFGGRAALIVGGVAAVAALFFVLSLLPRDRIRHVERPAQVGLRKTELGEELEIRR